MRNTRRIIAAALACSIAFPGSLVSKPGYYFVSDYTTPQAAIDAAAADGGGRVFIGKSLSVSSPIIIPDKVAVDCASRGVVVSTSSPTADLFSVPGSKTSVDNCGLAYTGYAPKTSGYLLNVTGWEFASRGLSIDGGCWICINSAGIVHSFSQLVFNYNFKPVAPDGGGIISTSEVLQLSSITGGSGPVNPYKFGIKVLTGAVDASGIELLQELNVLWLAPGENQTAFIRASSMYLDNCLNYCLLAQPTHPKGTIGTSTISGSEFGAVPGATPIRVDTLTYGGNVASVNITGSDAFSYGPTPSPNNAVDLHGQLNKISFTDGQIGSNMNGGFVINEKTQCRCTFTDNDVLAFGAGFWGGSVVAKLRVGGNVVSGGPIVPGGNPASSFYNNTP